MKGDRKIQALESSICHPGHKLSCSKIRMTNKQKSQHLFVNHTTTSLRFQGPLDSNFKVILVPASNPGVQLETVADRTKVHPWNNHWNKNCENIFVAKA